MPVKIRLQRVGKRDKSLFRLVVSDQHDKANGKTIAVLGFADFDVKPKTVKFDKTELNRWISQGAQLTDSVRKLLSL